VREKPNILSTQVRFEIPRQLNIRQQYIQLIQRYFKDEEAIETQGVRLKISEQERQKVFSILRHPSLSLFKIMICPGSKWANKQLPLKTLSRFLGQIQEKLNASFLLVWGSDAEKTDCEQLYASLPQNSFIVERLPIPTWQNLMSEVNLVIAVDSSALHLCGTTQTPSFSLFGPSSSEIYRPLGTSHFSLQGKCPYGQMFEKTCPLLRTCPSGACIRDLTVEEIYGSFIHWWEKRAGSSFR
jgi:heptosyltransferase-1